MRARPPPALCHSYNQMKRLAHEGRYHLCLASLAFLHSINVLEVTMHQSAVGSCRISSSTNAWDSKVPVAVCSPFGEGLLCSPACLQIQDQTQDFKLGDPGVRTPYFHCWSVQSPGWGTKILKALGYILQRQEHTSQRSHLEIRYQMPIHSASTSWGWDKPHPEPNKNSVSLCIFRLWDNQLNMFPACHFLHTSQANALRTRLPLMQSACGELKSAGFVGVTFSPTSLHHYRKAERIRGDTQETEVAPKTQASIARTLMLPPLTHGVSAPGSRKNSAPTSLLK